VHDGEPSTGPGGEGVGELPVELDGGDLVEVLEEQVGGEPGAGSDLEDVVTQVVGTPSPKAKGKTASRSVVRQPSLASISRCSAFTGADATGTCRAPLGISRSRVLRRCAGGPTLLGSPLDCDGHASTPGGR